MSLFEQAVKTYGMELEDDARTLAETIIDYWKEYDDGKGYCCMLEGFTRINKDNAQVFNQLANKVASIPKDDLSPYQNGKRFKLAPAEYCFAQSNERNTVSVVALLIDEDGQEQELWLSTILRKAFERQDSRTVEVVNNSTIAKEVRAKVTPNTTNKELGEIFANLVRGKEIICYRQVYARSISTRTGRPFEVPAALIGFEFA